MTARSDLLWYFNCRAAAFGFSSNTLTLSSCLGTHQTDPEQFLSEGIFRAVKKERRIKNKLMQLTSTQRTILASCFDGEFIHNKIYNYRKEESNLINYPTSYKNLVKFFGKTTGAVFFNSYLPIEAVLQLYTKKINKKLTPKEEIMAFQIGIETKLIYKNTIKDYEAIK